MKKFWKATLAFLGSCFLGATALSITDPSCDALYQYRWTVQFGLGPLVESLMKSFLIFVVGVVLFYLLRRRLSQALNGKGPIVYFMILPVFVFHVQFYGVWKNLTSASIERSICAKSTGDGMTVQSVALEHEEYRYLKRRLTLLPNLPSSADSISVEYYHDGFLGDFMLKVRFGCSEQESLSLTGQQWSIDSLQHGGGRKQVVYEDGAG